MKLKVRPGANLHEVTPEGQVHKPGTIITVKDERAKQLIAGGVAERIVAAAAAQEPDEDEDDTASGDDGAGKKDVVDLGAKRLTPEELKNPKFAELIKAPMPELQAKGQALGITSPLGTTKDQLVRAIVAAAAAQE